jgi:hypothetical protein
VRGLFQDALFQLLLAFDAMAGPGNGFQALRVYFFSARNALAEIALANAGKSALDHLEQLPVGVALMEQKLFVVGARGLIGDVLRHIFVRAAAILLIASHGAAQLLLPGFEPLSKCVQLLLVHLGFQTETRYSG